MSENKTDSNPVGRPLIKINWDEVDKLCAMQCTQLEIAGWFDCSVDTIDRAVKREQGVNFAEYFQQKRGKGLISLRKKQYETAMQGSVPLLIFLGKNYLGQADKQETSHGITEEAKKLIIDMGE